MFLIDRSLSNGFGLQGSSETGEDNQSSFPILPYDAELHNRNIDGDTLFGGQLVDEDTLHGGQLVDEDTLHGGQLVDEDTLHYLNLIAEE